MGNGQMVDEDVFYYPCHIDEYILHGFSRNSYNHII